MHCPFNHVDRIPDVPKDAGDSFVYKVPLKKNVYDTALGCVGVPFKLGHNGVDIDTDSFFTTRNTMERTREKNHLNVRTFSGAYFGSGNIYTYTDAYESRVNVSDRKSKSSVDYKSPIPNQFYYHFENVQKVNPLINGIHLNADTRMQLRKTINKKN